MKTNIPKVICDGCGISIPQLHVYKNDGSFQENKLEIDDFDICMTCFGKMSLMYFREHKIKLNETLPFLDKILPLDSRVKIVDMVSRFN